MTGTDSDNRPWPMHGDISFWAMRGMAIQEYSFLESGLFNLFCGLGDIDIRTAGAIFYRITSAASRNAIIEKMFKKKFGDKYNLFRNSLIRQLRPIDNERNEIVHWIAVVDVRDKKTRLRHPEWWDNGNHSKEWMLYDLQEFARKVRFYAALCNYFRMIVIPPHFTHGISEEMLHAWRDIFLQPITYPPPKDHPSHR